MPDTKSAPLRLELITQIMNGLAQQIGMLDPDDTKRDSCIEEFFQLSQAGDPRRVQIVVQEIMRLNDRLKQAYAQSPGGAAR